MKQRDILTLALIIGGVILLRRVMRKPAIVQVKEVLEKEPETGGPSTASQEPGDPSGEPGPKELAGSGCKTVGRSIAEVRKPADDVPS